MYDENSEHDNEKTAIRTIFGYERRMIPTYTRAMNTDTFVLLFRVLLR